MSTEVPQVDWKAARRAEKAARPWFKKKRFIIPLALLVLVILVRLLGGDDTAETVDTAADSTPTAAATEAAEPVEAASQEAAPQTAEATADAPQGSEIAGLNTPVRDGKFEFTVTGVERLGSTVGEGMLAEEAQGEFIIVRVDVTNVGDEAQMLSSNGQVLYNDKGQKFEPSSAIFSVPDSDKFFLENINPGNTVTGAPLLFDVAPGTMLDRIELHDSMFSGGVEVSLAGH